jgi:hypothetical protein
MSREDYLKFDNAGFAHRFAEACGSTQPTEIKRLLNISYQAAKNYLAGRPPEAPILAVIADKTPYSLHWLLTGRGKKFASEVVALDTEILARQIDESVRRICVEVINEIYGRQQEGQPKVVVLQSGEVFSETPVDEAKSVSRRKS